MGFLRRAAAVRVLTETCVISEAMIVMYMIKEDMMDHQNAISLMCDVVCVLDL